ncbi:MAG: ATP-binding protein [Candidatus Flexifilum sp.]
MKRLNSLRAKLILCFLLLTFIPLAATGLYGHLFTRSALAQQALDRSMHQVRLQAESINSAFRQVQGDALYLSGLRSLNMLRQQTLPASVELWSREVAQDLLVFAAARPMYSGVRLINAEGQEIIGVHADGSRVRIIDDRLDRSTAPYFTQTMRLNPSGVYVSPFQSANGQGAPYIHYAVRLPDGVLVIDFHAGWLLRALPGHPGADTWALLDQNGRFLVYPAGFDPSTLAADIPHILTGTSGSYETRSSVYVYDVIYPEASTTAGAASERYWVIVRHTPVSVLYASVNDFYSVAVILIVGSILVAILMALLISHILTEPVKQLELMAAQFGHDGIAPPLPAHLSRDEIGTLTRTFIEMARELEGKRRQEHRLIERLISAQEEERKLVAYDLHDGLIQQLVGARFYITNCRAQCPVRETFTCSEIQQGCTALTNAIAEGRRIIEGLRPAILDDLGLTAAIQDLAEQTAAAAGWSLELAIQPLPTEPEKTVAVTVYRIAQEALNNIRKHAQAHRVSVHLHNGNGIDLEIADDGVGFDFDRVHADGHGLGITTMQERASLINGRCFIQSAVGQGTRIHVHVPSSISSPSAIKEAVQC